MQMLDNTQNQIIVVILLSVLYLKRCYVNLWAVIYIVDDTLALLLEQSSLGISKYICKAALVRL